MAITDMFRKKDSSSESVEAVTEAAEPRKPGISEEEAVRRAKKAYSCEELYILLSIRQADYGMGLSIPYVCELENGLKGIIVFTEESYARGYVDRNGYDVVDGIYPIGMIKTSDKIRGLGNIVSTAKAMGVGFIDIDLGFGEDTIGCDLDWFMKVNDISPEVNVLVSEEEKELAGQGVGEILAVRFNPVKLIDGDLEYCMDKERSDSIIRKVFSVSESRSPEEAAALFNEESLFELCYTYGYIVKNMIPTAESQGNKDHARYFRSVIALIEAVVASKLRDHPKLYTIKDAETGKFITNNGVGYILYTDRFRNRAPYSYCEIPEKDFARWLKRNVKTSRFAVTDGPHDHAIIDL